MKLQSLLTAVFVICGLAYVPSLLAQTLLVDVEVPIDGGVILLVAAGVSYGAKKAYDKRKKQKDAEAVEAESK